MQPGEGTSQVGWSRVAECAAGRRENWDGMGEVVMQGVLIVQGLNAVMPNGHKCACMGCLTRPCMGGIFFNWALNVAWV